MRICILMRVCILSACSSWNRREAGAPTSKVIDRICAAHSCSLSLDCGSGIARSWYCAGLEDSGEQELMSHVTEYLSKAEEEMEQLRAQVEKLRAEKQRCAISLSFFRH
jgi:hypothetical protein